MASLARLIKLSEEKESVQSTLDANEIEMKIQAFEKVVKQLKDKDVSSFDFNSNISEYITLEDSLLEIIFIHSKFAISYEDQDVTSTQIFAKAILKYNELGADYQDTWNKEVWLIYDQLRSRLSKHTTPVKTKKLESDTDSSATTRTNVSPATDDAYEDYAPTLKSIDYEARKFKKTTVKEEQMSGKSCEKCIII